MEPPSLLPHVDELVMEYLLFRGFTKSFQVFSAERKRDRARGFDVDQIIAQLLVSVQTYQIETLLETWKFLTARFFNHLDASYASTLQQLETSLLRLYVVNAVKSGHRDKATEFFQLHADKLNASVAAQGAGLDSWSRWFILPYIEHPESDAYFQVFFGQPWLEAFVTSFRNFLSLVFRNLPLPKLLAFQLARLEEPTLKLRLKVSQSEATRLRLYNSEATAKIKKLEEAGRQLHSILRMMVQHNFMEHFSASTPSYVDVTSDRNKNRSRSRSYGAVTASVGLSHKQMKEIGELFGISSEESPHVDPPVPVDPRDMPRVAEVYLPVDELSDDEELEEDDDEEDEVEDPMGTPLEDGRGSDSASPVFCPIPTASSPPSDGALTKSSLTPIQPPSWSTNKSSDNIQASLIREFNMLNDWEPTQSAMTARSRFSSDGQFLAIAKLGNNHIDIWSANPVALSPSSTIKLPARLISLNWLGPGPSKQLLACTLEDGETMLWDSDGQEVISCLPTEENLQIQQLMCAREAPIAACLFTSRDEEDNALQQILVLHGGMEEPMQDYFPMEDKQLTCLAWSNLGNVLITGSRTGDIEFIDVIRPERIHRCNLISCSGSARIDGGNLAAICLSPDGESMLSVHENGAVVMEWSVASILVAVSSPNDAASDVRGSVIDVKPTLTRTYEMDKPLASIDAEVDTTIRFLGAADYFAVGDSAALHIFKHGEKRCISTFIPNQATVADLDWHPKLPLVKEPPSSLRSSQAITMNRKLAFDNRLCYERDVLRQQARHQRKLEQMVPTCHSPSKVYLDSNAPAPHPHLATNAKRQQMERDRQLDIYHQNQRLANKMVQIMNRQENIVLAASSRSRLAQRSHSKPGKSLMPRVPEATATAQTPGTALHSPQKSVHSPAHMHMPGIRLDASQTPLLDCHLSPEYAIGRGDACKKSTLVNRAVQKRRQNAIDQENRRLKERLAHLKPYYNTKKWDGEWQQHAHKFSHMHQDGTVGYLLPKTPSKRMAPPSRGGCKTTRERGLSRGGTNVRELPSLDHTNKHNVSRAGRLKELQDHRSKRYQEEAEEDEEQVRELPPCLLLEATTRQGVEITVDELQIELTRSDIAELGDRGLMIHGSWKDNVFGELLVNHDTLVEVAQIVDDLEIMIKLETVSQVPSAGNIPSLSTLLTDDELQKLLVGVVQQLRFQVAPAPPDEAPSPQLLISCIRDGSRRTGSSSSPRERSRPRTCPSTIVSENESQRQNPEMQEEDYQDDFNEMTFRDETEPDPLEADWAIRYKMAALLNFDGRRWRSVLRKGSTFYVVSSWFDEETGTQTIKTTGVGREACDVEVPAVQITYSITETEEILQQLEAGSLTVSELLTRTITPLLP
ncbi:hypothetical protein PC123_g15203 [Phytophthora cactorum]|nr:hypothetical protein PC120_g7230 [Phytophthora cactorum]KAG4049526.1 hypothetical protein PC123_g15203 [Phytophthora cactorum]